MRDLLKLFGTVSAIDHLDLRIDKGEFFTLLGSSGCGKTTLLRVIAGLADPDAGDITIGGASIIGMPPYRRPVNMMFQSYALFPHMNVEDNIGFGLKREGLERAIVERRVGEALELIQMQGLRRRRPKQLSGGQRQRVALARALVKQPQVLLLDEPMSALDKRLRESTQIELVNIQRQTGITFIMVTHDQQEAMAISSRMAVMSAGRIAQLGTPEEIYHRPSNRFVANFIGTVNLFAGRVVVADTTGTRVDSADLSAPILAPGSNRLPGSAVLAAVRPERIQIVPATQSLDLPNRVQGRVSTVAFLGDRRLYHVRLTSGSVAKVTQTNDHPGRSVPFSVDTEVGLGWDRDAVNLLED